MKRQVKFYFEFVAKKKYLRKELTRLFLKSHNFVFVQRKESLARLVNRCLISGSTRIIRKTQLSRQTFRTFLNEKKISGISRNSW